MPVTKARSIICMAQELTGAEVVRQEHAAAAVARAAALMARLRGPEGCPWDREQTFDSIKRHTLEETYEVFDAIERRAWPELCDELGDLLLQVLFYAQMASDEGLFTLKEVAEALNAKLVRRHPHIFGDAVAADSDAVLRNWEQIKREEKRSAPTAEDASMLDSVPRTMPALLEAGKLGSKAAKAGFDWSDASGLLDKLGEETQELEEEIALERRGDGDRDALELEVGDLLFTAVNLARHLRVDPESALRRTNAKFRARFRSMERAAGTPEAFEALSVERKEELWVQAKRVEAGADPTGEISA